MAEKAQEKRTLQVFEGKLISKSRKKVGGKFYFSLDMKGSKVECECVNPGISSFIEQNLFNPTAIASIKGYRKDGNSPVSVVSVAQLNG